MTDDQLSEILLIIGGALWIGGYWCCWLGYRLAEKQCAEQAVKPDFEQSLRWRKLLLDARCRAEKKNLK